MRRSLDSVSGKEVVWTAKEEGWRLGDVSADGRYAILNFGVDIFRLDLIGQSPRVPERMFHLTQLPIAVRLSHDGRSIVYRAGTESWISAFPPNGQSPRRISDGTRGVWPFFSSDDRTLYALTLDRLLAHPISREGIAGPPSMLFQYAHSDRLGANLAAASRDGKRILAIATEDTEQIGPQVISDWTALLPK